MLDDIQFKIIDVGGEREERVRWIDFLAVSLYIFPATSPVLINQREFPLCGVEHKISFNTDCTELQGRITCVIFLAAVDEYDTYFLTAGGETRNRLTESVELFSQIQHHQWLAHTTFILFLNKVS